METVQPKEMCGSTQGSDGALVTPGNSWSVVAKWNNSPIRAVALLYQDIQMRDKTGQFKVTVGDRAQRVVK